MNQRLSFIRALGSFLIAGISLQNLVLLRSVCGVQAYQAGKQASAWRRKSVKREYTTGTNRDEDLVVKKKSLELGILGMAVNRRSSEASKPVVSTVNQLRKAILDEKKSLSQVEISNQLEAAIRESVGESFLQDHSVLKLMKERYETKSKPSHRQDNATLALAIEGGGMRGCVSAGMAAAIASLGLSDTIDTIYGSSAGSVIGAYFVSRQMCVDVYVDILPAAKRLFVCKKRIAAGLYKSLVDILRSTLRFESDVGTVPTHTPGMNISFVLDSILGQKHGVRPLDFEKFEENNKLQELRIVASSIDENGDFVTKCFGSKDFFGVNKARRADGTREGLFACLEASMTVPAATGPPVILLKPREGRPDVSIPFFDAFCFEPLPYRSAVEEGATHVMVLASRPLGFQPKSKPGLYETSLAPLYFYSHGHPEVAKFFENGGQQYLYAEDILALKEAKKSLSEPVKIPPPRIIYGKSHEDGTTTEDVSNREETWKKAHMLPVQVPPGTRELGTLEQDKDFVLQAVRGGYSAAFNMLAPVVGVAGISGDEAAKLVFPDLDATENEPILEAIGDFDQYLLQTRVQVPGDRLLGDDNAAGSITGNDAANDWLNPELPHHTLLSALPGFQGGRLHHLAKGLRYGSSLYSNYDKSRDFS